MCVQDFCNSSNSMCLKDLVSFKCRYSLNCLSALSVDILRIVSIEDSVSFKHRYSQNYLNQGLGQLRALIFSNPLIVCYQTLNRKGKAPDQLQASIFSDHLIASLLNERGGPPVNFKHRYSSTLYSFTVKWKGRAPSQLQASIFSDH